MTCCASTSSPRSSAIAIGPNEVELTETERDADATSATQLGRPTQYSKYTWSSQPWPSFAICGCVAPRSARDAHSSTNAGPADQRREWLTGFTGSAGTALVTQHEALLWTDGRYLVQAAEQLAGTEWVLMRQSESGVPDLEEWVANKQPTLDGPIGAAARRVLPVGQRPDWRRRAPRGPGRERP